MIITKTSPFTKDEIEKLKEEFEVYIKTVIDIEKKICSAGCQLHSDSEKILLEQGSNQADLWGGGLDLETKAIKLNALINIRPTENPSDEILDKDKRRMFENLSREFFTTVFS